MRSEDTTRLIGAFSKNRREEIRVELSTYRGVGLINVRVWYKGEDGTFLPSKKGLALRLDLLPQLTKYVIQAYTDAAARGAFQTVTPGVSIQELDALIDQIDGLDLR